MKFSQLAQTLEKIENISSRNEMTEILADFLPQLGKDEIKISLYMMLGRIAPSYDSLEFNFSQKLGLKALATYGLDSEDADKQVKAIYKSAGDLGLTVAELKSELVVLESVADEKDILESAKKLNKGPEIVDVFKVLTELAETSGEGSQEAKMLMFTGLAIKLEESSARLVARLIAGALRLGLSDKTILDALSFAITGDKSLRTDIERAYGARADIGAIAEIVLGGKDPEEITKSLQEIKLTTGVPVAAKLVEREKLSEKVFERLGAHLVQPKLDGMRAQIHYDRQKGIRQIYSRGMGNLSDMFPDILQILDDLDCDSAIIDSEMIGVDLENDTYLPFGETMKRRRKYDVESTADSIPVRAMAFDLLYYNGKDISQTATKDRVELLDKLLKASKTDKIELLDSPIVKTAAELEDYFVDKVSRGLEGVICKGLETTYDPGTRNYDWIKLKANSRSDLVDTVDVVVIGYYIGRGQRAAHGIGSLLTAVYDPESDKFLSVAKVGSGFKDEDWPTVTADLQNLQVDRQPDNVEVSNQLKPDVWINPQIVIEVDADEITRSPSHTAAKGIKADFEKSVPEKGLSLRFPRLKIWNRDKTAQQATTVAELIKMYQLRFGD